MPQIPQNLDFLEDEKRAEGAGPRVPGERQDYPSPVEQQAEPRNLSFLEDAGASEPEETGGPAQDLSFLEDEGTGRSAASRVDENWKVLRELAADPEKAAKAWKMSQETGLPYDVVWEQSTLVEDRVARPDTEHLQYYAPGTLEYLGLRENMAVSQDDHGILAAIEDTWNKTKQSYQVGRHNVELSRLRTRQMFNVLSGQENPELDRQVEALKARQPERPGDVSFLQGFATDAAEQIPIRMRQVTQAGKRGLEYAAGFTAGAAVLGQIPPFTASPFEEVGAAATGFHAGATVGFAESSFMLEAGLAFDEYASMEDENGNPIDPKIAAVAGLVAGGASAGLEALGTKAFLKTVPGGEKLVNRITRDSVKQALKNPSVRKSLARVARNYAGAVGWETATEMAQEVIQIAGRELAAAAAEIEDDQFHLTPSMHENIRQVLEAGLAAARATITLGAPGTAMQAVSQARKAQRAKDYNESLNRVYEAAQNSKTRERSPEKFEEFLHTTGIGQEAFMDAMAAAEIFETDHAAATTLFQTLGVDPAAAEEQASQGRDIKIDTARAFSRLEPEDFRRVASGLKPSPGAMSQRDLDNIDPEQVLQDVAETYERMTQDEAEVEAELARIQQEAASAGYTMEETRHYRKTLRAFANRMGMAGRSRAEMLQKIKIRGKREEKQAQGQEAKAPEAGPEARDRVRAARQRIQKDIRRTRAEHEGFEIQRKSAVPEDIAEAVTLMRNEANASQSRTVGMDETGRKFAVGASSPEWMTRLQDRMKQAKEPLFSRREINRLIELKEQGRDLTERQEKRWEYLEDAARQLSEDRPELAAEDDVAYLEGKGYEILGNMEVPAAELQIGDQFMGSVEGVSGEWVHTGVTDAGEMVLERVDEEGYPAQTLDFFDMVRMEGLKRWQPEPGETVYFETEEGMSQGTFKQFRGAQALIDAGGKEAVVPRENVHRSKEEDVSAEDTLYQAAGPITWPADFPRATVHTTLSNIQKNFPELHEKAKAGDLDAAAELVMETIKPERIVDLGQRYPGAAVVPVHAQEAAGKNKIPAAYAQAISEIAGLQAASDIVMVNRPKRTGTGALHRLLNRPQFDGPVESGREYIIVDDAVTQGGTVSELRKHIEKNGGRVAAVSSLTAGRNSTILNLSDQTAKKVTDKHGYHETNKFLQEFGIAGNLYELTENEARYLAKYGTLDSLRDQILAEGFERLPPETQRALFPPETYGITYFQTDAAPPFYSELSSAVGAMDFNSMPAKELYAGLVKTPGIKQEEIDWTGLKDWLSDQDGRKVTKDQVLEYLAANTLEIEEIEKVQEGRQEPDPANLDTFETENGELRLQYGDIGQVHAISRDGGQTWNVTEQGIFFYEGIGRQEAESAILDIIAEDYSEQVQDETLYAGQQLPGGIRYREFLLRLPFDAEGYRSPHWRESNVVVHVRMNERTGHNGERVLFLEEVQSDWHQAGRKDGYKGEAKWRVEQLPGGSWTIGYGGTGIPATFETREEAQNYLNSEDFTKYFGEGPKNLVPNAPFKTTWPMLAIKRMVRYAAENAYDAVAWTPGEVQAERYDLSKHIESVDYVVTPADKYEITANTSGDHGDIVETGLTPEGIENLLGKEVAEKIVSGEFKKGVFASGNEYGKLENVDLKVGGEGMKAFYDRILVNEVNKFFGKGKWGKAKVQQINIPAAQEADIMNGIEAEEGEFAAHALPVTDKIRDKALSEGFPLFQDRHKGSLTIASDKYLIKVFENADISTLLHETGHIFLEEYSSLVASGMADQRIRQDYNTLMRWLKADDPANLTREQHEQFARAFERYLREGRAPSRELESAFNRFRNWLTRIYRNVKNLNVNLTDSVRSVFDRMLADEAQIRNAAMENDMTGLSKSEMDALGVVAEDRQYMDRLLKTAWEKAERAMVKDRQRGKPRLRKQWKRQAREAVENMPAYRLVRDLRQGLGLDRRQMIASFGADIEDALGRPSLVQENGRSPDRMAAEYGFETAREMVDALQELPRRQQHIEQLVSRMEAEHDARFIPEPYLADTEEYAEYLTIKAKYERRAVDATARVTPARLFERFAKARIEQMPIKDAVRHDRFMQAMKRAVNDERRALQRGDLLDASEANERARLNYALAQQASRQRKAVEKTVRKARKEGQRRRGFFDHDYHENILALVQRYNLGTPAMRPQDPANKKPLRDLVGLEEDPLLDAGPVWSEWLLSEQDNRSFRDLSVEEFTELSNLLDHLVKKGRDLVRERLSIAEQDKTEMVETLTRPALDMPNRRVWSRESRIGRTMRGAREYFANSDMLLFILRRMDGYQKAGPKGTVGPNEQYLYNALAKAYSDRQVLMGQVEEQISPARKQLLQSMARHPKTLRHVRVPDPMQREGLGWDFEKVIAAALNMGNPDNRKKLLEGYGMTEQELNQLVSILNEDDWNAIQQIWDAVDSLWPQLNEVHYRINGYYQKKIEPHAFTTPTGQVLSGGYYPLKYDGEMSYQIREWGEKEDLLNDTQTIYTKPAARDGHMISRQPGVKLPVKLRLSVLADHLDYAVQYITHAEAISDIDRITRDKEYRRVAEDKLGKEAYQMIRPALKHTARPQGEQRDVLDRKIDKHRKMATVYILGLNFSVASKQIWSLPGFINDEGFGNYMRGLAHYMKNPRKARRVMRELSPYMRSRGSQIDRDMRDAMNKFSPTEGTIAGVNKNDIRNAMFVLIRTMDAAAVQPAWWAAFYKGQNLYAGNIEQAVRYADEAIAATQPSSRPMDMSYHQRAGKGYYRLFTMFSTFVLKYGNRQRYYYEGWRAGRIRTRDYMRHVIMEAILPPVGMELMFAAIWGDAPDKEDLFWEVFLYQFIGMPFWRDIVNAVTAPVRDGFVSRVGDSPAWEGFKIGVDFGQAVLNLITGLGDEERWKEFVWTFSVAASYSMGIPAARVYEKTIEGMEQWERGEGTPLNVLIPNYNKD